MTNIDGIRLAAEFSFLVRPEGGTAGRGESIAMGVIALSHDPKLDDLALLAVLQSSAFYVGAIGSRRRMQQSWRRTWMPSTIWG